MQAYIQSVYKMVRRIFLRPVKELRDAMRLPAGAFLEVILPLYGVKEAGDYWDITFQDHHIDELGMETSVGDHNLLYKIAQEAFNHLGLCGLVTDDFVQGGNHDFTELTLATERKFESKPRVYNEFNFARINIMKNANGFIMQQTDYIDKFSATKLRFPCTISEFRSLCGQLYWINHTRPDILFPVAYLSQVIEESLCEHDVKLTNNVFKHFTERRNTTLRFVPLDLKIMHIVVYTDSSFANNKDCSSQIGFIFFLNDDKNNANLIYFSSRKAQWLTRSILDGKIYAFADSFDYAFILQHDLRKMLNKSSQSERSPTPRASLSL